MLQAAYDDAVTLAEKSQNVAADNIGFTNYFGGEQADVQLRHFKDMMQDIGSPAKNYAVRFTCVDTKKSCASKSVMVADATPGSATDVKTIVACPAFWTAATTAYLLFNPAKITPSPPYRGMSTDPKDWCARAVKGDPNASARTNQFFATAGHSGKSDVTSLLLTIHLTWIE